MPFEILNNHDPAGLLRLSMESIDDGKELAAITMPIVRSVVGPEDEFPWAAHVGGSSTSPRFAPLDIIGFADAQRGSSPKFSVQAVPMGTGFLVPGMAVAFGVGRPRYGYDKSFDFRSSVFIVERVEYAYSLSSWFKATVQGRAWNPINTLDIWPGEKDLRWLPWCSMDEALDRSHMLYASRLSSQSVPIVPVNFEPFLDLESVIDWKGLVGAGRDTIKPAVNASLPSMMPTASRPQAMPQKPKRRIIRPGDAQ